MRRRTSSQGGIAPWSSSAGAGWASSGAPATSGSAATSRSRCSTRGSPTTRSCASGSSARPRRWRGSSTRTSCASTTSSRTAARRCSCMELVEGEALDARLAGRAAGLGRGAAALRPRRRGARACARARRRPSRPDARERPRRARQRAPRRDRLRPRSARTLARAARPSRACSPGRPSTGRRSRRPGDATGPATDLYALGCILYRVAERPPAVRGRGPARDGPPPRPRGGPLARDRRARGAGGGRSSSSTGCWRATRRAAATRPRRRLSLGALRRRRSRPTAGRRRTTVIAPRRGRHPRHPDLPRAGDDRAVDVRSQRIPAARPHRAPRSSLWRPCRAGGRRRLRHRERGPARGRRSRTSSACGVTAARAEVAAARAATTRRLPKVKVVDRSYSESAPVGVIIAQDPPEGDRIRERGVLLVSVSRGSAYADVPSVAGLEGADAFALLERSGFTPTRRYAPSTEIEPGTPSRPTPPRGTNVKRPARVELVVSTGPPKRPVPVARRPERRRRRRGAPGRRASRPSSRSVPTRASTRARSSAASRARRARAARLDRDDRGRARAALGAARRRSTAPRTPTPQPLVVPAGARLVLSDGRHLAARPLGRPRRRRARRRRATARPRSTRARRSCSPTCRTRDADDRGLARRRRLRPLDTRRRECARVGRSTCRPWRGRRRTSRALSRSTAFVWSCETRDSVTPSTSPISRSVSSS